MSYDWTPFWFSKQFFNQNDYSKLGEILKPCKKATYTLQNHWKQEPSLLQIPRSYQCAERAIKVMQEIYNSCVKKDTL